MIELDPEIAEIYMRSQSISGKYSKPFFILPMITFLCPILLY